MPTRKRPNDCHQEMHRKDAAVDQHHPRCRGGRRACARRRRQRRAQFERQHARLRSAGSSFGALKRRRGASPAGEWRACHRECEQRRQDERRRRFACRECLMLGARRRVTMESDNSIDSVGPPRRAPIREAQIDDVARRRCGEDERRERARWERRAGSPAARRRPRGSHSALTLSVVTPAQTGNVFA